MASSVDVIVIGGGPAGIGAASILLHAGHTVTVLEAQDRLGGRTKTLSEYGYPIDLMAEWIHNSHDGNPVLVAAKEMGCAVPHTVHQIEGVNKKPHSSIVFVNRHSKVDVAEEDRNAAKSIFQQCMREASEVYRAMSTTGATTDFGSILRPFLTRAGKTMTPLQQALLWQQVEGLQEIEGISIDRMNPKEVTTKEEGGNTEMAIGYGTFFEALAGQEVRDVTRLNTVVTSVANSALGVAVKLSTEEVIHSRYCICCVPLGVLQAGSIQFEPPLDSAAKAKLDAFDIARFEKVVVEFESDFGADITVVYPIETDAERGETAFRRFVNWSRRCDGRNVWVGYTTVAFASRMREMDEEEVMSEVKGVFKVVFPKALLGKDGIRQYHMSNCLKNPYFRGSWSVCTPEMTRIASEAVVVATGKRQSDFTYMAHCDGNRAEPVLADTTFFRTLLAGEWCGGPEIGCAHGAYMAGTSAGQIYSEAMQRNPVE